MNEQEELWAGEFGKAYLERNKINPRSRIPFWSGLTRQIFVDTALEVGCSRGHNMAALLDCEVRTVIGIDINRDAVAEARAAGLLVMHGGPVLAPLFGPSFDLVFTAGVLIHISPEEITDAMKAIAAASKRYVLAIEYESDYEQEIEYRGHKRAMWKRPYGQMYGALGFKVVDTGNLGPDDGFDNCKFWLMEKA